VAHLGLSLIYFLGFNATRTISVYLRSCVQGFRSENWSCRDALSPPGLPPPLCWPLERSSSFLASVLIYMYSPSPDLLQPPYWWWSLDLLPDLPIRSLLLICFLSLNSVHSPTSCPPRPFFKYFSLFPLAHLTGNRIAKQGNCAFYILCVWFNEDDIFPFVCIISSMVFPLEFYVYTLLVYSMYICTLGCSNFCLF
jgi:hypothetical protein